MITDNNLDGRIRSIFQKLFDVGQGIINDETRRGDLERWDSLGHLDLVEALRVEFQIDIGPEEALEMETVADIKQIISVGLADDITK